MLTVDPLPTADIDNWKKLEPAFDRLRRELDGPYTPDAQRLSQVMSALRALNEALTACGLKWIADDWETVPGAGSYARKLLQLARDPSGAPFADFWSELSIKDETFIRDMGRQIRQFADQLIRRTRPLALERLTEELWITVTEAAQIAGTDPGTISRAVTRGEIPSNGRKGHQRKIPSNGLTQWCLARSKQPRRDMISADIRRKVNERVH